MTARTEIRVRQIRRRTRQYRLWYLDDELYYGAYAYFTQKAVIKADETAYTIAAGRWPSGLEQIVCLQDEDAPTFHVPPADSWSLKRPSTSNPSPSPSASRCAAA